MGGGEGRAGTDGNAGGLPASGETVGSDLNSWRIVSVAEFRVAVEPGCGARRPPPCPPPNGEGNALLAGSGAAADLAAGAVDSGDGTALEAFIETTINGTAATAASRWAAMRGPATGRCRPIWKMPNTTATRAAA